MKHSAAICVFCAAAPATTWDHVPPKSIFTKPRPNLITVPACKPCNEGASNLDEKFKVFLGIKIWPHDSSSYEFWSNGALRSIRANKRIHREILSGPTVLVRDESGRFIESIMVKWDASSHDKTIEKITRGLYFHEFKKILNSNTKIDTYFFNALDNEMKNHIMFLRSKNIGGDDRFVYAFLRDDGNPEISFWFYQFYQGHWAGAFTGPEGFEWDGSKSVLDAISDALRLPKQPSDENSA